MVATIRSDAALAAGLKGLSAPERQAARMEQSQPDDPRAASAAVVTSIANAPESAALALLRGSLDRAIGALDVAIGAGGSVLGQMAVLRDLAAEHAEATPEKRASLAESFERLVARIDDLIDSAWTNGVNLIAGAPEGGLRVDAALDGGGPLVIAPEDFRGLAGLGLSDADALGAALAQLSDGLSRLTEYARKLDAHAGFLGKLSDVAQTLGPNEAGLDADGARLQALSVRQSLQGGGFAIANAAPVSVLALFRE